MINRQKPDRWQFTLSAGVELEESPVNQKEMEDILRQMTTEELAEASRPETRLVRHVNGASMNIETYLNPQGMPQIAVTILHNRGMATARFSWKRNNEGIPEPGYEVLAATIRNRQDEYERKMQHEPADGEV